jgi:hypothetical protein
VIGDEIDQRLVVIAAQAAQTDAGLVGQAQQKVDHAAGLRSSIDIVAQADDDDLASGDGVLDQGLQERFEKIGSAMHVAERADDQTFGKARIAASADRGRAQREKGKPQAIVSAVRP